MAARKVSINHHAQVREKIKTSQLVKRLVAFALQETDPVSGKAVEMTKTQVTAALGLLRKTVPDLSQISGAIDHVHHAADDMTDSELAAIARSNARRGRNGTAEKANGSEKPDSVH